MSEPTPTLRLRFSGPRKTPYLYRTLLATVVGLVVLRLLSTMGTTLAPPPTANAHQLFETLVRAVVAAGAELVLLQGVGGAGSSPGAQVLESGQYPDGTPERHTVADKASAAVLRRIGLAFPGLAIVDEEEVASGGGWMATHGQGAGGGSAGRVGGGLFHSPRSPTLPLSELSVFLDPLDGTQEYTEGMWEYVTVSACIVRCGHPIVGVIFQPSTQRLYWSRPGVGVNVAFSADAAVEAERALPHTWEGEEDGVGGGGTYGAGGMCCSPWGGGKGGSRRGRSPVLGGGLGGNVSSSPTANTPPPRILVSRSHSAEGLVAGLGKYYEEGQPNGPPPPTVLPKGGAGYKLIQLLEGGAEAYLHPGSIRKWDVCAGEALVRAGGGRVSQWAGKDIDYCLPPLPPPSGEKEGEGGGGGAARKRAVDGAVRVAGLIATKHWELGESISSGFAQWWLSEGGKTPAKSATVS